MGILPSHATLGDVPHAVALRRRRRAAHAAGGVRQPRGARAAAAPAVVRALRLRAHVLLHQCHDRQPGGARVASSCGLPVEAIDDDGSPQAERSFAVWQRPLLDRAHRDARVGQRRDRDAAVALRRRRAPDARVHPQPQERRARRHARARRCWPRSCPIRRPVAGGRGVPRRLPRRRAARARGEAGDAASSAAWWRRARSSSASTSASLDAVVLNGFPGTLSSMRQQVGRAGRTTRRAAAVLVAGDDQLDQWYARHPDELLARPGRGRGREPRRTRSSPGRRSRARPTSCRSPTRTSSGSASASTTRCATSWSTTSLRPRGGRDVLGRAASHPRPASGCGAGRRSSTSWSTPRGASSGTVDAARVFQVAHPGAIYLHQGRQYRVTRARRRRPRSRCSSPPTTSTSTRNRARRPTSRSSRRSESRAGRRRARRTSAR